MAFHFAIRLYLAQGVKWCADHLAEVREDLTDVLAFHFAIRLYLAQGVKWCADHLAEVREDLTDAIPLNECPGPGPRFNLVQGGSIFSCVVRFFGNANVLSVCESASYTSSLLLGFR